MLRLRDAMESGDTASVQLCVEQCRVAGVDGSPEVAAGTRMLAQASRQEDLRKALQQAVEASTVPTLQAAVELAEAGGFEGPELAAAKEALGLERQRGDV